MPDFSDDQVFREWFNEHCWNTTPVDMWTDDRAKRVASESRHMRRELDRRYAKLGTGHIDGMIYWSGAALSLAGAVVLFFPPAGAFALVGYVAALGGLIVSATGVVRRGTTADVMQGLAWRSRELNALQRALVKRATSA